jgi:hypothetical protein
MRRPSPAFILALIALFVALGGAGMAATGGNFILGQPNSASTPTSLSASVASSRALTLTNLSTATGSTALGLNVAAGHAPFTVNTSTKVANLNADQLDGFHALSAPGAHTLLPLGANKQFARSAIPGKVTAVLQNRPGPLPLSGTFTSSGGNLVITASGSGYHGFPKTLGMLILVDGVVAGEARVYDAAGDGNHHTFVPTTVTLTGIPAATHTLSLTIGPGTGNTQTDSTDYFTATVEETPASIGLGQDAFEPDDSGPGADLCNGANSIFDGGVRSLYATISPAGDVDWYHLYCDYPGGATTTTKFVVSGGAVMDVYINNALAASNVTSFQHTSLNYDDYAIRVHAANPTQYRFSWTAS